MALVLDLVIDPGKAQPEIVKLSNSLTGLENVAARCREAMEKTGRQVTQSFAQTTPQLIATTSTVSGFRVNTARLGDELETAAAKLTAEAEAAQRAAGVHERLQRQNQPLVQGFAKLNEMFEREQRLLNEIHGPVREYTSDLAALDAMLARNVITTEQYATQVTRLNQRIAERPEKGGAGAGEIASGMLSAAGGQTGSLIAGIAGGGIVGVAQQGLGMMAEAIRNIGEESARSAERMREMRDVYAQTANVARKFADDGHTTNQIIDEQQQLAHALHAKLEATMGIYDAVRDGVEDLNMSHGEQLRLTESLGKAIQLAGKPLEAAGGFMSRLSYAMASGSIEGMQLVSMMRDVPPIAQLWTQHFGVTRAELVKMVQDGKINVRDLANVLITDGDKMDQQWSGQKRTIAGWRDELKQAFEIARGQGKNSYDALREALAKTADQSIDLATRTKAATELVVRGDMDVMGRQIAVQAALQAQQLKTASTTQSTGQTINQVLARTVDQLDAIKARLEKQEITQAAASVAAGVDALTGSLNRLGQGVAFAFGNDIWAGPGDLVGLLSLLPKGSKLMMEHASAVGAARKQLDEMRASHEAGVATAKQVQKAHEDLATVLNGGELPAAIRLWHEIHDPVNNYYRDVQALDSLLKSHSITVDQHTGKLRELSRAYFGFDVQKFLGNETAADRALRANAVDRAQRQSEIGYVSGLEHAASFTPEKKLALELEQLERAYAELGLSVEAYNAARAKAFEDAYNAGAFGSTGGAGGASEELKREHADWKERVKMYEDMARESREAAEETRRAWAQATGEVIGSFAHMALEGKASFAEMTQQILKDIARVMLQKAMMEANKTGGSSGTLGMIVGAALGAFKDGGDMYLPRAATGADWRVGGSGPVDSKKAEFWVSPGESIHVRTPEQRRAAERESRRATVGGGAPPPTVINNVWDPHALRTYVRSSDGKREILNLIRTNPGVVRGYLER